MLRLAGQLKLTPKQFYSLSISIKVAIILIVMNIVKVPQKLLTKKLKLVALDDIKSGKHSNLIDQMRTDMIDNNGVGLAANQVGKDLAIFVIDKKLADENNVPDTYINPEITEYSKKRDDMEEGCLSIPEYFSAITRSKKIKIKALDEKGNKFKIKARGLLARVYQHETDHLNGITIKNRIAKLQ